MNTTSIFLTNVIVTTAICIGIVLYIAKPLRALLMELCGSAERAGFWVAFSTTSLVLVPLVFALAYQPTSPSGPVILEVAAQVRSGLIGFLLSFGALGLILLWFLPNGGQ